MGEVAMKWVIVLFLALSLPTSDLGAAEPLIPRPLHLESVVVEMDREALRPSGSRLVMSPHRKAELQMELERSLRAVLEQSLAAQGIALTPQASAASASIRVRASRVQFYPISDALAVPLASYGRSEAKASLTLEVVRNDGHLLFRFAGDYASPDPGELRPQSALQSRKALEALFARFAREAVQALSARG